MPVDWLPGQGPWRELNEDGLSIGSLQETEPALPENLLTAMAEMEASRAKLPCDCCRVSVQADAPRSVVDDPVLRAYLAVYKSRLGVDKGLQSCILSRRVAGASNCQASEDSVQARRG